MSRAKKFKTEVVYLRLSGRVKERLKRAAEAREQHASEFMRLAVITEIQRAERAGEVANLGANGGKHGA